MHIGDPSCWPGLLRQAGPLSRSQTVPRESVHRVSPAEVLLTDVRLRRPGRFEAAARWPHSHVTVPCGKEVRHSFLMVVETLRQLGIHIPHRYFGVPTSMHFLITDLSWRIDAAAQPANRRGADEITCLVASEQPRRAPGTGLLTALRLRVRFLAGARCFAHAEGGARFVDDARYASLRGRPGPAPRDLLTCPATPGPACGPSRRAWSWDPHATSSSPGTATDCA